MWIWVGCPCPPVSNDNVTPASLVPTSLLSFVFSFVLSIASFISWHSFSPIGNGIPITPISDLRADIADEGSPAKELDELKNVRRESTTHPARESVVSSAGGAASAKPSSLRRHDAESSPSNSTPHDHRWEDINEHRYVMLSVVRQLNTFSIMIHDRINIIII